MPIKVDKDKSSFFKNWYSIKYITGWDNSFKREYYTGLLNFYDGDPLYIVDVSFVSDASRHCLFVDKTDLQEEDIIITVGDLHNASNLDDFIIKNTNVIYEICKSTTLLGFALDLQKMKIIDNSDFNMPFPRYGLTTLFRFDNIPNAPYYCLVNPTNNINNREFFSWFTSYVYSTFVCLTPRNKVENYAKQFMQAISTLYSTKGDRKAVSVSNKNSVLECGYNDLGEYLLPVPGNKTERFEALIMKAAEQMNKAALKKEKSKK
jgi:hypothetical protein